MHCRRECVQGRMRSASGMLLERNIQGPTELERYHYEFYFRMGPQFSAKPCEWKFENVDACVFSDPNGTKRRRRCLVEFRLLHHQQSLQSLRASTARFVGSSVDGHQA